MIGATRHWKKRTPTGTSRQYSPDLRAARVEDSPRHFLQLLSGGGVHELGRRRAQKLAARCQEKGVVAGPDPKVGAVLVELEHEVVERGQKGL